MLIIIFSRGHHQDLSLKRNLFLPKPNNFIPAIYAMFNIALGFAQPASAYPFLAFRPQTSVGDTLTWGRGTFTPRSRNSFSPRRRKAQGNGKGSESFFCPPLGTFLISCVFCQDKLNFYERRRRRRRRVCEKQKKSQKSQTKAAETLNFSHLVKFILSQVITL